MNVECDIVYGKILRPYWFANWCKIFGFLYSYTNTLYAGVEQTYLPEMWPLPLTPSHAYLDEVFGIVEYRERDRLNGQPDPYIQDLYISFSWDTYKFKKMYINSSETLEIQCILPEAFANVKKNLLIVVTTVVGERQFLHLI